MQAEIRQLQEAIQLPGVPDDEKQIYVATIQRIQAQIDTMQSGPVTQSPTPPTPQTIKHTAPPPPPSTNPWPPTQAQQQPATSNQQPTTRNPQPETRNQKPATSRHIHAGNQTPVHSHQPMSATIQADHSTNPHNPTVTITWADGYTYAGDETAIRGRFTTTFRDTIGLRLVQQGRYTAMWRWSSPWRAAGFYQALTHLIGAPPNLQELGVQRPNELTRSVFQQIIEKATVTTKAFPPV